MPDLIVFDIDGTIVDSVAPHQRALLLALESFGFARIDTDWDAYRHHTDSWIFHEVFRANRGHPPSVGDLRAFDLRLAAFLEEIAPAFRIGVAPGFHGYLGYAKARGNAVAFATGSMRRAAEAKLRLVGIGRDVPLATASEHYEREAIVTAAIEEAERRCGAGPFDRVVSIGDGRWDLETARQLGVDFLGMTAFSTKLGALAPAALLRASFFDMYDGAAGAGAAS